MDSYPIRRNFGDDGLQVVHESPGLEYYNPSTTHKYNASDQNQNYQRNSNQGASKTPLTPLTQETKKTKGFKGMKLWLAVAVIVLIVALAAIGAWAGSKVSRDNSKLKAAELETQPATSIITPTSTETSTPTASSSTATTASQTSSATTVSLSLPTVGILPSNCSGSDTNSSTASGYNITCNQDYLGVNFQVITAYTFQDCLNACTNFNTILTSRYCLAVSWLANITTGIVLRGGNCFLKNESLTDPPQLFTSGDLTGALIGAIGID